MLLSWSLWFHFFLILIFRKTTRDVVEWKIRCEFLSEKLFLICTRNNVFGKNCFGFGFSNCCQQTTVFAARYLFFGNQVIICFIWNISFQGCGGRDYPLMDFFRLSLPVCFHKPTFSHPRQNWFLKGATPRALDLGRYRNFPRCKTGAAELTRMFTCYCHGRCDFTFF